jgi:hypothetical protein
MPSLHESNMSPAVLNVWVRAPVTERLWPLRNWGVDLECLNEDFELPLCLRDEGERIALRGTEGIVGGWSIKSAIVD